MHYNPSLQTNDYELDAPCNQEEEIEERDYDQLYDEERERDND